MAKTPSDFPTGSTVSFKAGPSQVTRTGKVTGTDGQFVVVDVEGKALKTRPGAILA